MGDTPNKHSYPGNNINDTKNGITLISIGKVISNTDTADGGRIKVRIKGIDDQIDSSKLPFCLPMLPRFINIVPKVGESVLIFKFNTGNNFENRMWLGPIISQPQKLKEDPHNFSSTSLYNGGILSPEASPSTLPDANGIYPKKEYIALQGRDNTDLIFKDNEVLIRAGKFKKDENLKFNKETISYIQLKNDVVIKEAKNNASEERGTVVNVVANKINLLTHKGSPRFVLNGQDDLISDKELNTILTKSHPMVYGDKLNELLYLFQQFVSSHTHPYPGLPPVQDDNVKTLLNYNLEQLLSQNIRIN